MQTTTLYDQDFYACLCLDSAAGLATLLWAIRPTGY
jgi:hypothetical protein